MVFRATQMSQAVEHMMEAQSLLDEWERGDAVENRLHPRDGWLPQWDRHELAAIREAREEIRQACQGLERERPLDVRSA